MQILSKITIGGQELKNRIVLSPMTRARYGNCCRLFRQEQCVDRTD
jgi:2,4-dienoyl-CoA reductase-like NADH-dependent reductase (Old Yellow Enzyme family)